MATDLPPEMRKLIDSATGPVEFVDRQSDVHYVLIRAEYYERMKNLIQWDEPSDDERMAIIQQMGKSAGWEDPSSDDLI